MDTEFEKGLSLLKKAEPNRVVEVLFQLFCSIERMDVAEVVGAKRTLDLFLSLCRTEETALKILKAMDSALVSRARTLFKNKQVPFDEKFYALLSAFGHEKFHSKIA